MLSVAEKSIRDLNAEANPLLFGQDWNDEAWAVCRSDMLIKGEDADNITLGDTFTKDAHARDGIKLIAPLSDQHLGAVLEAFRASLRAISSRLKSASA